MPILLAAITGLLLGLAVAWVRPRPQPRRAADPLLEGALAAAVAAVLAWACAGVQALDPGAGLGIGGVGALLVAATLQRLPLRDADGWRKGACTTWIAVVAAGAGLGILGQALSHN